MKASAPTLSETRELERPMAAVVVELVKARLTALVVLTTLMGFYAGSTGPVQYGLMFHAVMGTALLACGAAALNQLLESELDAKMKRTENRPLPSGRVGADTVAAIGVGLSATGMVWLAWKVNLLTSLLGAATLVSYLFIYTPLKTKTTLNTMIGAIPGALPPLMGWTAATNQITPAGWSLFAILFFWQLPHFLAIAWMYRDDYRRAGYAMLPVVDPEGVRTGRQAVSHTLGLLPVSLSPVAFGIAGPIYLAGALLFGLLFLAAAIQFSRKLTENSARVLFFSSIIYLPLTLGLLVFDKLK